MTTPDEPVWSAAHIEALRDAAPTRQQPVPAGITEVSQDPHLPDHEHEHEAG
jgi:hypothetical protein